MSSAQELLIQGLINQRVGPGSLEPSGFGGSAPVIKGMKYIMVTNLLRPTVGSLELVELIFHFFFSLGV